MNKIKINPKDNGMQVLYNLQGGINVIKKIAWNTFKNTGDINTFLELMEIENIEKNIINGEENNGDSQNKWNSNTRK